MGKFKIFKDEPADLDYLYDKEDIIHKRMKSRRIIAEEVLCGRWAQHNQTSYQWKDITCKQCLKHKKLITKS